MNRPVQDWILLIAQFILAASLLPTIFGADKPELPTAVFTAIVAWVITGTFVWWRAWLTALGAGTLATCWAVVALQVLS